MTHVMIQDRIATLNSELETHKNKAVESIMSGELFEAQAQLDRCLGIGTSIDELESVLAVCQAEIDEMLETMEADNA